MENSVFNEYKDRVYKYRYEFYKLGMLRKGTPFSLDAQGLEYRFRAGLERAESFIVKAIGDIKGDLSKSFVFEVNTLLPETSIVDALEKFNKHVLTVCLEAKKDEKERRAEIARSSRFDDYEIGVSPPDIWDYFKKKDADPEYAENTFSDWDRLLTSYQYHLEGKSNSEILVQMPRQYLPESCQSNRDRKLRNDLIKASSLVDSALNGTFPSIK